MKIISPFKDYYDFAVGFDSDSRKVFVRRPITLNLISGNSLTNQQKNAANHIRQYTMVIKSGTYSKSEEDFFTGGIWFCDNFITYLQAPGRNFYFNYNDIPQKTIKSLNSKIIKQHIPNRIWDIETLFMIKNKRYNVPGVKYLDDREDQLRNKFNSKLNAPIIFSIFRNSLEEIVINGKLSDIKFGKVKTPAEAYTDIYNFVKYYEPDMPNSPTDMARYEAKGFSKKTSFRNM